jgi:D-amino peptidase
MRVLMQVDMEGAAQITDYRELVPLWASYWRQGRRHLTDDVAAAAFGLLDGGATEVVIDDQHLGLGETILAERLPRHASIPERDWIYRHLRAKPFDAVFQVGRHARWGTESGFVAHTQMPGMALAIDGQPITECHINAWRARVPVLGITGDDRLADQIDGTLSGTPFLAVKHSSGPTETRPAFPSAARAGAAIQAFAAECARRATERPAPALPSAFALTAMVDPDAAAMLDGQAGLRRIAPDTLALACADWWRDAEPAVQAVTRAAAAPFFDHFRGLDLSTEERALANRRARLATARRYFGAWLQQAPAEVRR